MKRTLAITISTLALALAAGCKKDDTKATGGEAAETGGTDTETPAAQADAADQTAKSNPGMLNQMKHCPSAVEGANTSVEKTDKEVVVIVNTKDQKAATEARERAKHLASVAGKDAPEIKHTGEGTGGGLGKCPVILTATKVASEDIEGGVKITITPADPESVQDVYEQAAERAKSLNEREGTAHGSGAGGGHGMGKGGGHGGQKKDDKGGAGADNPCGGADGE